MFVVFDVLYTKKTLYKIYISYFFSVTIIVLAFIEFASFVWHKKKNNIDWNSSIFVFSKCFNVYLTNNIQEMHKNNCKIVVSHRLNCKYNICYRDIFIFLLVTSKREIDFCKRLCNRIFGFDYITYQVNSTGLLLFQLSIWTLCTYTMYELNGTQAHTMCSF